MTLITTLTVLSILGSSMLQAAPAPVATLELTSKEVTAGAYSIGFVTLTFADGLHGYQNPPSEDYQIPVQVQSIDGAGQVVVVKYPKGEPHVMGGETKASMTYGGTVRIAVILRMPSQPGPAEIGLRIRYQQCDESTCFPPGRIDAKIKVVLTKAPNGQTQLSKAGRKLSLLAELR